MKYTVKTKLKDGSTVYRFVPPKDAKLSGVVKNKTFQDGRTARYEIPKLIKVVEDFRKGRILAGNIDVNSNLRQVLAHYYKTGQFNSLSLHTQKTYTYGFNKICVTKMFGRELGDITLKYLTPTHCTELYETWVKQVSVDNANQLSRIFSVLINFCISLGLMDRNPMSMVKKRSHEPRSVVWTQEQVELFVETAFSQFKYRNIGLLALLCYEWGQRPVDIRLLKWSSIDFDNKMVTIKQTKRGATVQLPLEDKLEQLLLQQNDDWGFQDYVLPYQRPSDGAYSVIEHFQVSALANEVKALCGLPRELQMGDLRKTAITELIRSGVDQLAIMSVTGHRNVQSLNPYNKHNFNTAKSALEMRRK
jgi:integrase